MMKRNRVGIEIRFRSDEISFQLVSLLSIGSQLVGGKGTNNMYHKYYVDIDE